jgi:hypothetical protein
MLPILLKDCKILISFSIFLLILSVSFAIIKTKLVKGKGENSWHKRNAIRIRWISTSKRIPIKIQWHLCTFTARLRSII